jgi:predicted TIM-barrel fold metal-dependent hydrolase
MNSIETDLETGATKSQAPRAISRRGFVARLLAAAGAGAALRPACVATEPPDEVIDAHSHVWTPDRARYPESPGAGLVPRPIDSFTPDEFFAHARPCGVRRVVLIQMSFYGWDNSYMLDMMEQYRGLLSGVARVDEEARPAQAMRALKRRGVRGFRIVPRRPDADHWLDGAGMAAMWKCGAEEGLAICPLVDPPFLAGLETMCRRYPATPVVIDHFARIGLDGTIRDADLRRLCGLARYPGVRVKLSAFYALGRKRPPHLDLAPMIRRVLEAFGPQRLMWASDCPFQVLDGHRYRDSVELVRQRLDFLTDEDRRWLLRRTAEQTFFA